MLMKHCRIKHFLEACVVMQPIKVLPGMQESHMSISVPGKAMEDGPSTLFPIMASGDLEAFPGPAPHAAVAYGVPDVGFSVSSLSPFPLSSLLSVNRTSNKYNQSYRILQKLTNNLADTSKRNGQAFSVREK